MVKKDVATIVGHIEPINHTADGIAYDNTTSGLTSDNVQDAIDEITTGTIVGPGSSTDQAIVRWDGITGTIIQDSPGTYVQDGGGVEAQGFITNKLITDTLHIGNDQTMITSGFSIELTGELIIEGDAELVVV